MRQRCQWCAAIPAYLTAIDRCLSSIEALWSTDLGTLSPSPVLLPFLQAFQSAPHGSAAAGPAANAPNHYGAHLRDPAFRRNATSTCSAPERNGTSDTTSLLGVSASTATAVAHSLPENSHRSGGRRGTEVRRQDLDVFLLPYLRHSAVLSIKVFDNALAECLRAFPYCNRGKMASLIREWFRKKREYMSHRIHVYCRKNFCSAAVLNDLRHNQALLNGIRGTCNVEITDEVASRKFVIDRVASYFDRHGEGKLGQDE